MTGCEGFEHDIYIAYEFNKSLYGLKQAPRYWNQADTTSPPRLTVGKQ
jgi:hypothetical protein